MKKLLFLFYFAFCILHFTFSKNPLVKQWDKRFGGTSGEVLLSFQHTADKGYFLAGWSTSGSSGDKTQPLWDTCDSAITSSIIQLPNYPITISPNPSSGIFQITFPTSNQKTNYTLEVINTLGQTVFQDGFSSVGKSPSGGFRGPLDLSFLPKGMYVLRINDGVLITCSKLIIE